MASATGFEGKIHLEHVQLIRKETVPLLKSLHITCHMQPCHWLSDRSWLDSVLDPSLITGLFQWNLLTKNDVLLKNLF